MERGVHNVNQQAWGYTYAFPFILTLPNGQTEQENNTRGSHLTLKQRGVSCDMSAEQKLSPTQFY